jgi:hypothetical protein
MVDIGMKIFAGWMIAMVIGLGIGLLWLVIGGIVDAIRSRDGI